MLKLLVPKFRYNLSIRLRDIAEKQIPARLKPIVVPAVLTLQPGKDSVMRCCVTNSAFLMKSRHRKLVRMIAFHSLLMSHDS